MEVHKNIILDLLPMYLANEASPETRELVEEYMDSDKDLAKIIRIQKESLKFTKDIPVPLSQEDQITAFRKSRIQLALIILFAAILLAGILGTIIMMFLRSA
jgi:ABC-type dipeptide/oligopeptide/nickel transport system permease component